MVLNKILLEEDLILIENTIRELADNDGYCQMPRLCLALTKSKHPRVSPPYWAGYLKALTLLEAFPDRFEIKYFNDDKTDCRVSLKNDGKFRPLNRTSETPQLKIVGKIDLDQILHKKRNSFGGENKIAGPEKPVSAKVVEPQIRPWRQNGVTSINTNQIFKYITPEIHEKCKRECILNGGLENFDIFQFVIKNRIQKLVRENKIFRNHKFLALNPSIVARNGSDPYYLTVRSNHNFPDGVELDFVNRQEHTGRNMLLEMGNTELKGPDFPSAIFDPSLEIVPEYHHILVERQERLPEEFFSTLKALVPPQELAALPEEELMRKYNGFLLRQLKGSVAILEDKLKNGVVKPVPFWYAKDDKICWYVPLEMGLDDSPSMVLVLNESDLNGKRVYRGHTLISLQDAYKCARVIGNVNSDWCLYPKIF